MHVRIVSAHHIDAEIRGAPGEPWWRITGFYGHARTGDRGDYWQLLRDLADLDSLPWVIIGDFNEILNNSEKLGGPLRSERQMRGFRDALGYGDLADLGFQGAKMTWWNSETQIRLDRAVGTSTWSDIFGYSRVKHLSPSDSDHVPILLQASSIPLPKRPKRHSFKFESFWLQHQECDPLVLSNWKAEDGGAPMFVLTRKIINTRCALESWQHDTFRLRQNQMVDIRSRLEAFWKQWAKVTWLQEGDRNPGFFHRKAANRKRKNILLGLFDHEGQWKDDDEGMENIVTSYFSKMFTATDLDVDAINLTLAAIQPCVTSDMNQKLCAPYSEEEVKCALFQMYSTKSPGPDGMPPLFFQHYWEDIGKDVTEAVQNPENMADLRPIALCNVIYKLCSKVIANRLKVFLPYIISPFQSAFVPGRLITDNILVANEVAHFVHNKREGQVGYIALKLDLSKAYDRMEWAFLRKVLERFGFASTWIDVVMQCVYSVRYSFLDRGKPKGLVIPTRGLRQGDPLSPYLFLIGAESFSALLQQKQRLGLLPGIAICSGAPSVNHLLFADDSMLYAQATPEACFQIKDVIQTYGRASGQVVNFHKSSVVFSKNVADCEQDRVANLLGVEVVESHERYLGLPTYIGCKKTATFLYIKERLAEKLKHWQGKMLSGAGKDILIRVVAQALPNYAMSVFQLTKNFCEDLEHMCARFWWGSTDDKRKIHWKKWDDLCHAKEEGGLEEHVTPSYSWRSIFCTRNLLIEGAPWQIGNGNNVLMLRDSWIPNTITHKPQLLGPVQDNLAKVNAEAILAIPLSARSPDDRLTWHLGKQGMFTVKSAYRHAFSKNASTLSLSVVSNQRVWKNIWHAKIPSTAKVNAWRICHNILPTLDRLPSKNVILESQSCVFCNEVETIIHLTRDCAFTREVLSTNLQIAGSCFGGDSDQMDALNWLNLCVRKLSKIDYDQLLHFIWGIWKERNDRVWENKITLARDIALIPSSGKAAIGFLVGDSQGNFLGAVGKVVTRVQSAEHVELLACKEAFGYVMEHGLCPVILETDCLVLKQQVCQEELQNYSILGRLYEDLRQDLKEVNQVRIIHARREANMATHKLAAHAADFDQAFFWSNIPSFIQDRCNRI
ncbi:uncharacterized protein LOC133730559 [Rosa rugosa]|uniref:uncharacterized protein LOC133730559 n=1 Tax=Rosa rugosa TaxID=74645 RepID=UPI002B40897F|nr:uncharacterized protein LOC133730559 [Rosa rugosa]